MDNSADKDCDIEEMEAESDSKLLDDVGEEQENGENGETGKVANNETEEVVDEEITKVKNEHYIQNKPNEFSSENFKIELGGLPIYYLLGNLKKLLYNILKLDAHRVKKGGMGRNVAYVNFRDDETVSKALTILNGYKWKKSTLTARKADPAKDPMLLAKIEFLKGPKEHEQLPLEERIKKAVTPYHAMSYEDQIKEKDKAVRQVLWKFGNELSSLNPELKKFAHWHKIRHKGRQICEIDDVVESPLKEGYQNKCEFTIGKNSQTSKPVVGFRVASYKEGSVEVGPVAHLRHLNETMKHVVKLMEQYLEASKYEPFDPFTHVGIWRQLTVRTSNNDDVMLVIVIHPQEMEEEEINFIKEDLKKFFTEGDGKGGGVTSMFFQQHSQMESGKDIEFEHIYGKTYIEATILGKTFKVSPDAFLQVNTAACEVLYKKIAEVAEIDAKTTVLDLCCGVGTIGLTVAESAHKVMGVELTEKAVENAKQNALDNNVSNAVFYHGRAEDYIDSMIQEAQKTNTVAIVDPPRTGISGKVMNALRKCEYLNKLVYVSCDPQAEIANFKVLGRVPNKIYKGTYFVPIRAIPVDLFPDTPHYELIVVFERYDKCKWDGIMNGNPRPEDQEYFNRIPEPSFDQEQAQKDRDKRLKQKIEKKKWFQKNKGRGGGGWRDDWGGGRDWRDDGYKAGWGGGSGRAMDHDGGRERARRRSYEDRQFKEDFGDGYQEGYQAALEAVGSQLSSGFGQGGGWNKAQSREEYGGPHGSENYTANSSTGPKEMVNKWAYDGNEEERYGGPGPPSNSFNIRGHDISMAPGTYPLSVTNPTRAGAGGGFGFQTRGWNRTQGSGGGNSRNRSIGSRGGSTWRRGAVGRGGKPNFAGSQIGGSNNWNQNPYQSFEEPSSKKWKGNSTKEPNFDCDDPNY